MSGEKKQKTKLFLTEHPNCCLCGGKKPAENIEHAPPRVLFLDKHRPKGHEVPACRRCNNGSSQIDQLVAMYAFTQAPKLTFHDDPKYKSNFQRAAKGVKNNSPELLNASLGGAQKINTLRNSGLIVPAIKMKVNDALIDEILNPWGIKQALAFWYIKMEAAFSKKGVYQLNGFFLMN